VNAEGGVHILEGEPGTGKSFLTKKLIRHYDFNKTPIHITGSTGAAASRLSNRATTVHTGFGIGKSGSFLRLISPYSDTFANLYYAQVLLVDEFSMLTSFISNLVLYRLCQVHNTVDVNEILRKVKIIFVGDSLQLPAVCHHVVDSDSVCNICRINMSTLWPLAARHLLTTVVRQANDPPYLDFLRIIRSRKPTQAEIDFALSECFCTPERVAEMLCSEGSTFQVLTSHLDLAAMYNDALLANSFPDQPIIEVPLHSKTTDVNFDAVSAWLHDSKFYTLPAVKIGVRVILCENLDLSVHAHNGATGIVQSVHYRVCGILNKIVVQLDSGATIQVMRTKLDTCYVGQFKYYKTTFPLNLASAMTGHRCQGATFSSMILIHVSEAFCPGMLYVMLSRVTERQYLRVCGRFTPDDFVPVPPM
jgi:ATP-dependent DNA helicase PIF1